MDKTIIGLVGAASALALAGGAQAANIPAAPMQPAQTFAELLDPIPDAVSRLSTQNGDGELSAGEERPVQLAQYYHHHHHHHHHWHWWHRHHHHHHHHHHHYY